MFFTELRLKTRVRNIPFFTFAPQMPDGVIGNTSDSESEESRFEPWSGNLKLKALHSLCGAFFCSGYQLNLILIG